MDWLSGMNAVLRHIEDNLTEEIAYEGLSKIVGVSVYEFSRIFSFMAGMSVSEYIRRRRLSQAVFDIKNGREKIIDIGLKFGYESHAAFTRAFKELHGTSPAGARKPGVALKNYPPISFILQIKGVGPLTFRIEERGAFGIMGFSGLLEVEDDAAMASLWNSEFAKPGFTLTFGSFDDLLKDEALEQFENHPDTIKITDTKMGFIFGTQNNGPMPQYMTAAIYYACEKGKVKATMGFAIDEILEHIREHHTETEQHALFEERPFPTVTGEIPAATYAVFSFTEERNAENMAAAYARILTEWFPAGGYKRVEALPHLERILITDEAAANNKKAAAAPGSTSVKIKEVERNFPQHTKNRPSWEIWMPVEKI